MIKQSSAHDPDGDVPIDLGAPQFSRSEAAFLARLAPRDVINWMGRGHIGTIGWKNPKNGYWLFSIKDVVRLSVMFDFCARKALLLPAEAAEVAEIVLMAGIASIAPEANTDGHRPNVNVIVSWDEHGRMAVNAYDIKAPSYYPPRGSEDPDVYIPLRRGHLVIPATAMLNDTILRTRHLPLLRNREAADA